MNEEKQPIPTFIEQLEPEKKKLLQDFRQTVQQTFDHISAYEKQFCLQDVTLFRYLDGYDWNLETGN